MAGNDSAAIKNHAAFIWSVADLLRGDYKQSEYGKVILPLTVIRRLDCVLEPTKAKVLAIHRQFGDRDPLLRSAADDNQFYNTSVLTLRRILDDSATVADNLAEYIAKFSPNARDVIEKFDFHTQIARLDRANLLYLVLSKFCDVDLHPEVVSNVEMGYLYEELIRRFSELSNETAGEHFTPREVIRLMVELLFTDADDLLHRPGKMAKLFDPACGTGGMLSVAADRLREYNPDATLEVFGQELNAETYAVCRSDMMIKGEDADNIRFGNSFSEDAFEGERFDYLLANPPFGVEWKKVADTVRRDRRWIIENDWLEAVVALPDQLFYNTGISTYFWVVTNRKSPERRGKVQLVDARELFTKMRKSLGEKRKQVSEEQIGEIVRLYADYAENDRVKIFPNEEFGFLRITVERPLRLRWEITEETLAAVDGHTKLGKLEEAVRTGVRAGLQDWTGEVFTDRALAAKRVGELLRNIGVRGKPVEKAVLEALAVRDPEAEPVTDEHGNLEPDPDLRDYENVPLPATQVTFEADPTERLATLEYRTAVEDYLAAEVLPYVPDAWIDHTKTRIGYEIPLTRHFYKYVPPRPLAEIDAEIKALEAEIQALLNEVTE